MAEDWARPLVAWEIEGKDAEKLTTFYSTMFNWPASGNKVKSFPAGIGAPDTGPAAHVLPGESSRIVPYIQVLDLQTSLDRAVSLGGSVIRGIYGLPGRATTFAAIADPEGNKIVLVQQ
jgi:predicted enzyme related to lactoylglutathione lyase